MCQILATIVESVRHADTQTEIVGASGLIKINAWSKLTLVENITEGIHRIVGLAVTAEQLELRIKTNSSLLYHGVSLQHPLHGQLGVRVAFPGKFDRPANCPGVRGI